jgi:hypothetical protein
MKLFFLAGSYAIINRKEAENHSAPAASPARRISGTVERGGWQRRRPLPLLHRDTMGMKG